MAHYKAVLAQTEELLTRLQARVEAEERVWKGETARLRTELAGVQEERDFWMQQLQQQDKAAQVDVAALQADVQQLRLQLQQAHQVHITPHSIHWFLHYIVEHPSHRIWFLRKWLHCCVFHTLEHSSPSTFHSLVLTFP